MIPGLFTGLQPLFIINLSFSIIYVPKVDIPQIPIQQHLKRRVFQGMIYHDLLGLFQLEVW